MGTNAAIRPSATGTGRRRAWAEWMTACGSAQSALLARVTVNRFWQACFGTGLVSTPDNLGVSGSRPSHPELLEWLAAEFVESGWDTKAMLRRILHASAFRQASVATPEALERDASNQALSRFPLRRLEAEQIRDAILSASGRLGAKSEGPYVPTMRDGTGEVVVDEGRPDAFSWSRLPPAATHAGDDAAGVVRCPGDRVQLHPAGGDHAALAVPGTIEFRVRRCVGVRTLRNDFAVSVAGTSVRASGGGSCLWQGAVRRRRRRLGRGPFWTEQRGAYAGRADAELRAWADFGQALLAMNSFLYLESTPRPSMRAR